MKFINNVVEKYTNFKINKDKSIKDFVSINVFDIKRQILRESNLGKTCVFIGIPKKYKIYINDIIFELLNDEEFKEFDINNFNNYNRESFIKISWLNKIKHLLNKDV